MSLTITKFIAAAIIFLLALLSGLLPMRITKKQSHLMAIGEAFAGGVFLSAALLHMIPNALANFSDSMPNATYPLPLLIIALTFIFLFLLEHGTIIFSKKHFPNMANTTPYVLTFLISIHSLLEGAAIGINTSIASASVIFFAVLAHKGSESFALSLNLHRYKLHFNKIILILIIFSLMTPLGIFITTHISNVIDNGSCKFAVAFLNALAAGTFLYLGTVHIIAEPENIICRCGVIALLAGVGLMSAVALWV